MSQENLSHFVMGCRGLIPQLCPREWQG